ncbi:MAG: ABC transporter permease subunit [Granulosicoccus sp.]
MTPGRAALRDTTKEAAVAFGCSKWQLLRNVELPLALPSIMTGVNQTILMSLSVVVIASLIGAEGLGALILEALQYAAKGQGLLGGIAILLCVMVIDRIAQGMYRRKVEGH